MTCNYPRENENQDTFVYSNLMCYDIEHSYRGCPQTHMRTARVFYVCIDILYSLSRVDQGPPLSRWTCLAFAWPLLWEFQGCNLCRKLLISDTPRLVTATLPGDVVWRREARFGTPMYLPSIRWCFRWTFFVTDNMDFCWCLSYFPCSFIYLKAI